MTYLEHYASPLGPITLASDGAALTGLWFDGQKYFGSTLTEPYESGSARPLEQTKRWLEEYFAGGRPDELPPLRLFGSPFRRKVWHALLAIPYGETATYAQLARSLDTSPRAVGGAVGHNPISILVPCHRVVGAAGALTGYAGGIERKARLLALEGNVR